MEAVDYIVIGAGSAGCVVARRLSDDPSTKVLLIEAGPPGKGFWIGAPAGMAKLFRHKRYNWNFVTEPVPTLRNRELYWPRGKVLGGSSTINGMVYVRGDRRDFDHWAALGNKGWGWDDVLPYFKLSENNTRGADAFHGASGPLTVSDPVIVHPSISDFIQSASEIGIEKLSDLNAGNQDGVGITQFTIRDGVRVSCYDAFLKPVRNRSNLAIVTEAQVSRVVIENGRATGVEVIQGGEKKTYAAAKEIIISGGALGSPHILMLSGIGNEDMLRQHNIPIKAHSPGVGQNLQDHFSVRVQAESTPESSYNSDLVGIRQYWQGLRYVLLKKGYLALGSSTAAAFVKSSPDMEYADLEISFRPMTFTHHATGKVTVDPYHAVSASVYRVRPSSRGEIVLKNADPLQPPMFKPNYLGHPEDVTATLSGLKTLRRIMSTGPLSNRIVKELIPGSKADTDDALVDYMEQHGHCAFHPAGTCKMGNDELSVVDERLRVRGVLGLRVVDASIMPVVTSGNTNAPAIMIGEKGAAMIKEDAGAF